MKTLLLDIETAPNIGYIWNLFRENIPLQRLIESGYTLCWSAKWLGKDEMFFGSVHNSRPKTMLKRIHRLLSEADAVVHYYGSKFDIPTLNKEFLLNGFPPPAPFKQIDLYNTACTRFRFPSNKLDYIAQVLGVGKKHQHSGFQLWADCMAGNEKAWEEMETYNKKDVLLLEGVYYKFLPWIKGHPNAALYVEDTDNPVCPNCGSDHLHKRGFHYTRVNRYRRYQCQSCGSWPRARKAEKTNIKLVTE